MDRVFLEYYEDELVHIREMAQEFAALHPAVARNLALDTVPCPDPYVERLLEGVAFLAARTRNKVDAEASRFARNVLETLYPDMLGPAPAMTMAILKPGAQVMTMQAGHKVARGTRLVTGLREGLATRATYTTAQDVTLWPIKIASVEYLQDRGAIAAAGAADLGQRKGESGLRLVIERDGPGAFSELALDRLDLFFAGKARAAHLFDAIHGATVASVARPAVKEQAFREIVGPKMVGIEDDEGLLPRTRASFEGYRLLREYFLMPERFFFARYDGLQPLVKQCGTGKLEIVFLFGRVCPELADVAASDVALFAGPLVNLFERDCDVIEIDNRKYQQVLHADRTRSRDFEIFSVTSVEDADQDGTEATIPSVFGGVQASSTGQFHATERRPRRPGEDERRDGQMRTSYGGDDVFISISGEAAQRPVRRLAVRALCTNRDLAILDDNPALTLESGDPVSSVQLLAAMRPPRASLPAALPKSMGGESRADDLAWRLVSQLSLNFLSLAEDQPGAEPLRALLTLYADRGDPALLRQVRAIDHVTSRPVIDRLNIAGPMCFGRGTEITLHVDENMLSGHSNLLLSALIDRLFARYAGINSFVRTRTRLMQRQEEIVWPIVIGNRCLI